jgi:hypothetical protein
MPILAAIDVPSLVSIAIGVAGVAGLIFTALRWRRDDTTAVLTQQNTIVSEMTALTAELRTQRDEEHQRNTELTGELREARRQLAETQAMLGGKMRRLDPKETSDGDP